MSGKFDKLLAQLQTENTLRASSLIITFFGDAIVSRGGNVSAKTVQTVLDKAGTGAGTLRTAFSRLASDEWIVRQKIGRESFYELADNGYLPFKEAAARIYAPVNGRANESRTPWLIGIKEPGTKQLNIAEQGIQVTTNCWLFNAEDGKLKTKLKNAGFLMLSGELEQLPHWATSKLLPDACAHDFRQLKKRFAILNKNAGLSPLESLAARCLLIHQWRRVLLRTPVIPEELLPGDWPEQSCREFVATLYHQLIPKSEVWLDEHATSAAGSLPKSAIDTTQRFTQGYLATDKDRR